MKVAIDARLLTGAYTGDRTYWRGLLKAFAELIDPSQHRLVLFSTRSVPANLLPESPLYEPIVIPARSERLWSLWHLPRAAQACGCEVAHVQYTVSPLFRIPVITTIHDVSFLINPRWFPLKDRLLLRWTIPFSCRRAARVLTVSETSRRDILRLLRLPPEKVVATPNGLPDGFYPIEREQAQAWVRQHYRIEPPFLLAVGVLQPRKNWLLAIQAVAYAREWSGLPLKLVLTGKPGWAKRELEWAKRTLVEGDWLIETGYVPDEHLVWLYNAAEIFLYPSFYEGFGLPPLEAMACGTPVIASNGGALPEVVASGGVLLPPDQPAQWAHAILILLQNDSYREGVRQRALQRAQMFNWQQTAQKTWQVYEEAVHCG
ncbi:MAG: glycosyltransferase family 1 protein [Armatimonadota bacterium]